MKHAPYVGLDFFGDLGGAFFLALGGYVGFIPAVHFLRVDTAVTL